MGLGLAAFAAFAAWGSWSHRQRTAAQWAAAQDYARTAAAQLRTGLLARPVLTESAGAGEADGGGPGEGEAFAAWRAASGLLGDEEHAPPVLTAAEPVKPPATVLSGWGPVLAAIDAAARCGQRRVPSAAQAHGREWSREVTQMSRLATVARLSARAALAAGDGALAVRRWCAVLSLALDLEAVPVAICELVAVALVDAVTGDLDEARLAALSAADSARLGEALAQADAAVRPELQGLVWDWVWLVQVGEDEGVGAAGLSLGSHRGLLAQAVAERIAAVEELRAAGGWPRQRAILARLDERDRAGGVRRMLFGNFAERGEKKRSMVAGLRMLRMAAALHAGAPPPALIDPFTDTPFEVREEGGGHVIVGGGDHSGGARRRVVRAGGPR